MAPLDLEVGETCALGHMGGVLTVFGRSDSSTSAETQGRYSQGGAMRNVPFRDVPRQ